MSGIFDRVLIATDGSENNMAAVEKGLAVARLCGSAVYAVYVVDAAMADSTGPVITSASGDLIRRLEAEGMAALGRVQEMAAGLELKTIVILGRPAPSIVACATENKADLIVVGSQGKGGIERLLLGSVASKVVQTADRPVLVVKSRA